MIICKQPQNIHFSALRWTDSYGNTYHRVKLYVGNESYISDYTYGYGTHYCQTALEMMQELGLREKTDEYLPSGINKATSDWYGELRSGTITHTARDVKRKKDMFNF